MSRRRFLATAFGGLAAAGGAYSFRAGSSLSAGPHAVHLPQVAGTAGLADDSALVEVASDSALSAATSGTLPIPPLLAPLGSIHTLTMAPGETELLPGTLTPTLGFNGGYLGPTICVRQGGAVQFAIANQLGEPTTVHWHGMHLPPGMDGGPHQVIEPGAVWRPGWIVRQQAATLWYHPHLMGATQAQVSRGLAALLIIDDANPAQQALPHTYGFDDLPLILQDAVIRADGQLGGRGRGGGTLLTLVNGAVEPWLETPARRVRLRILNASTATFYTLGLADDSPFLQIASDGGLLPTPVSMTRLQLGPAERVELFVDLEPQTPTVLQARTNNRGPQPRDLLRLHTTAGFLPPLPLGESWGESEHLNSIERIDPRGADVVRDMVLARGGRGFVINGQSMRTEDDMMHMDGVMRVQLGDTELWRVINNSGAIHLFHVHDVQFQIVDRNGEPPPPHEVGWKDTVMVRPGETARIIMTFADYADPERPYMFHCHILNHEDGGMMGQFVVVPRSGDPAPDPHAGMAP